MGACCSSEAEPPAPIQNQLAPAKGPAKGTASKSTSNGNSSLKRAASRAASRSAKRQPSQSQLVAKKNDKPKLAKGHSKKISRNSADTINSIGINAEIGDYLKRVPLFANLNKHERNKLGGALNEVTFAPGEKIFGEGEDGDTFYIVNSGEAVVSQKQGDKLVTVCQLQSGDYFGEQSILTEGKRNASIHAGESSPLTLWALNRQAFQALFRKDRLDVMFVERRRMAVTAESEKNARSSKDAEKEAEMMERANNVTMTAEVKKLVTTAVDNSILFKTMDAEFKSAVVGVMHQEMVPKGNTVIQQGEEGDRLFVVEEGGFDVFIHDTDDARLPDKKVDYKKVGECFGDLALMYNAPRNATCTAAEDSLVRVLERHLFNKIIREREEARLLKYSNWLKQVELLMPLSHYERMRLAEAMEVVDYEANTVLVKQGEEGNEMFLMVAGEVAFSAYDKETGKHEQIPGSNGYCRAGGYFGERALLNNAPRAATVTTTKRSRMLRVGRAVFEDLLGPLAGIMKKKEEQYDRKSVTDDIWIQKDVKLADLKTKGTLGRGSYGQVMLMEGPDGYLYALKQVSKQRVVETHQKAHIFNEKNLLARMDHPFLVKLHATYKDNNSLYFLMEPALGGELFRILRRMRAFPPSQARFYGGCVILAFSYMHTKNLIYRDLKPENLLLDSEGYIKITDFGFCKEVPHKTWTMCGTPEYMAPETVQSKGHGKGVDWWTVGILIYEMLVSYTPFYGPGDIMAMYQRIIKGHFKIPSHVTAEAKSLIVGLLQVKSTQRLGCMKGGSESITDHAWFRGFDWEALLWKKLKAPMAIKKSESEKLTNFSTNFKEDMVIKPYVDDGTGWDDDF